jgi:hypothetical protein
MIEKIKAWATETKITLMAIAVALVVFLVLYLK